jgi:hypothetical protein
VKRGREEGFRRAEQRFDTAIVGLRSASDRVPSAITTGVQRSPLSMSLPSCTSRRISVMASCTTRLPASANGSRSHG